MQVLDYGRTFFDHAGGDNEVRMPIDSRVWIESPTGTRVFYGIREHFGENTDQQTDLFRDPSFDFRPVLGSGDQLFFRRAAAYDPAVLAYKEHKTVADLPSWGTRIPIVPEVTATLVSTFSEIREASHAGRPLVSRIELPPVNGHSAIIEHPVNSISIYPATPRWQVNAGPVPFPRFDELAPTPIEDLDLAFVTYNRFDYCEFLMENAHDLGAGKKVIHFNTVFARQAAITLWAV